MLELFGVTKRHDIQRDAKSQRGFSGLKFRADVENGPEATLQSATSE